jgi:hypothetical protein
VVEDTVTGLQSTDSTTHVITMPSGIVAGERLVVLWSKDGGTGSTFAIDTVASGSDWVEAAQATRSANVTGVLFWKIATGSDALTLTTSVGEQSAHLCYRISNAAGVTATAVSGSSANANPPPHTPPTGEASYLWIASHHGDDNIVPSAAPADFTDLVTRAGNNSFGVSIAAARRELNAASLDPGAFTTTDNQWVAITASVEPP